MGLDKESKNQGVLDRVLGFFSKNKDRGVGTKQDDSVPDPDAELNKKYQEHLSSQNEKLDLKSEPDL